MSAPVIQVENLSKLYRLGEVSTGTISHDLNRWWHKVRGRENPYAKIAVSNDRSRKTDPQAGSSYAWVLKDINFQVNQGDVIGIIGRNGAGKSTLLKILSRVTAPTSGRIKVKGRIASLLEVGTGFHQELTGRENIYLNGAILGMGRREITRKLDDIVEFSGCDAYLDTPVKRYSSGMTVRLAFAVASHLDAEILVIDEVLAVGDGEFQKKCLGKMNEVARQGRTLLFVSHNMGLVSSLCQRAILLEEGALRLDAGTSEAVLSYYTHGRTTPFHVRFEELNRKISGNGGTLLEGAVENMDGKPCAEMDIRKPFQIRMRYRVERDAFRAPYPNVHITDSTGAYVFVGLPPGNETGKTCGVYEAICKIPGGLFNDGTYFIGLALTFMDKGMQVAFFEKDALCINLFDPLEETLEHERNGFSGSMPGTVRPNLVWEVKKEL